MRKKLQNKQHFAKNLFEGGLLRQAPTTSGGTNNNLQHPKKETFDLEDRDDDDKIKSASTRGQRQKNSFTTRRRWHSSNISVNSSSVVDNWTVRVTDRQIVSQSHRQTDGLLMGSYHIQPTTQEQATNQLPIHGDNVGHVSVHLVSPRSPVSHLLTWQRTWLTPWPWLHMVRWTCISGNRRIFINIRRTYSTLM